MSADRDALLVLLAEMGYDVRPVESPSAREIADWFEREADPNIPDDWRLRTARTIRHEWGLS